MKTYREKLAEILCTITKAIDACPSDDKAAQETILNILYNVEDRLNHVEYDERPQCEECGCRMDKSNNAGNDLCCECDSDAESERQEDNASYAFMCYPRS
jgi:hypothetical protein